MRWRRRTALFAVVALGSLAAACSGDDGDAGGDAGDDAASGQGATGERASSDCSRDELATLAEDYFVALAAHDPDALPLSSDLEATENGEEIEPGQGIWPAAGDTRFTRTVVDTESCGTHTQAVLAEGGAEVLYGVRLAVAQGEITEMETYVSRQGDYFLFSTDGLVESANPVQTDVRWEDPVPEDQRSTRQELADIADSYFESFGPAGYVAPMRNGCYRWENGVRTTDGDCVIGFPPEGSVQDNPVTNRRYAIADVERGVVVAYVRFARALDFHMFKVVGGQIRLVSALVTAQDHDTTGWEEQE